MSAGFTLSHCYAHAGRLLAIRVKRNLRAQAYGTGLRHRTSGNGLKIQVREFYFLWRQAVCMFIAPLSIKTVMLFSS